MVIIVGGGPAGLAMAYELRRRGLPYRVLERATIGHAWLNHYDRLRLHTLKQVSALPGLPMPADYPTFPSAQEFHAYLADYARFFELNVTPGVEVTGAQWTGSEWAIATTHGAIPASTLVVATGIWSTPVCPQFEGADEFQGATIHASAYRNPRQFAGQRVLVVGAGNSGSEIAVDLAEHGVTTAIAIRSGATFVAHPSSATAMRVWAWLFRHVPRKLGEALLRAVRRDHSNGTIPPPAHLVDAYPVVGYGLPDAVAAGHVALYGAITRFTPTGVCFADGRAAAFDSVVLATGFRPTVKFIAHEVDLDAQGQPRVDEQWRSRRNPHLVCVGFRYPATEGWLQAIGRVASEAAAGIAATTAASPTVSSASAR